MLIGITLNLQTNLGRIILIIFSLPAHECSMFHHLFRSFLDSFIKVWQVLLYKSFTSFVRFISSIFIYFTLFLLFFCFWLPLGHVEFPGQGSDLTYTAAVATLDPEPTMLGWESSLHPSAPETPPILLHHSAKFNFIYFR